MGKKPKSAEKKPGKQAKGTLPLYADISAQVRERLAAFVAGRPGETLRSAVEQAVTRHLDNPPPPPEIPPLPPVTVPETPRKRGRPRKSDKSP